MAGIESEVPKPTQLVLVRGTDLLSLKPQNDGGSEVLKLATDHLEVALNDGRLVESPFSPLGKAPISTNPRLTLARSRKAYINEPNDPDRLADYMEYFWKNRRPKLGVSISTLAVPTCPWNESQIANFRGVKPLPDKAADVRDMVRFIPEVVAGDLRLIERGFPEIHFRLYGGVRSFSDINSGYVLNGWGRSEAEIDAPYTYTTEQQLRDKFEALNRKGLTVPAYAIFGVFSQDLTKQFLDQIKAVIRTIGSALGSSGFGGILNAGFSPGGGLDVGSYWGPVYRGQYLGGRSFQGA